MAAARYVKLVHRNNIRHARNTASCTFANCLPTRRGERQETQVRSIDKLVSSPKKCQRGSGGMRAGRAEFSCSVIMANRRITSAPAASREEKEPTYRLPRPEPGEPFSARRLSIQTTPRPPSVCPAEHTGEQAKAAAQQAGAARRVLRAADVTPPGAGKNQLTMFAHEAAAFSSRAVCYSATRTRC
jgi:hypothetical protein